MSASGSTTRDHSCCDLEMFSKPPTATISAYPPFDSRKQQLSALVLGLYSHGSAGDGIIPVVAAVLLDQRDPGSIEVGPDDVEVGARHIEELPLGCWISTVSVLASAE